MQNMLSTLQVTATTTTKIDPYIRTTHHCFLFIPASERSSSMTETTGCIKLKTLP